MENPKMNQIIYDGKKKKEIVYEEDYKNHHIVIVSYGTHPCGYVSVGKAEAKLPKDYFDFDIDCHGCVTFYGNLLHVDKKFEQHKYVGWDYAHYGDYAQFEEHVLDGKKWTTEEILEEARSVTEQLIDKYESNRTCCICGKEFEPSAKVYSTGNLPDIHGKAINGHCCEKCYGHYVTLYNICKENHANHAADQVVHKVAQLRGLTK